MHQENNGIVENEGICVRVSCLVGIYMDSVVKELNYKVFERVANQLLFPDETVLVVDFTLTKKDTVRV